MALVTLQPSRVRESLKAPASLGIDLLMLVVVGSLGGALFSFGREVSSKSAGSIEINLSLWALPLYTFFSLTRGFAAYALSLIFTLIYGSIAAHNRRAEKFMVPALDVLQSIPVLSFLPVLVLAMIRVFPGRELGLEIACVVMIFTGQAWNMTFSYYSSVKALPNHLREVATVHCLTKWQTFRLLELPASMIGLVWNSMMSMAGGWFFLSLAEAFKLKGQSFQLPGIGSYMARAIIDGNHRAEIGAVVAMILMIVAVDQLFWRPIVAWSERFKVEETPDADKAQSWVLTLLSHSLAYQGFRRMMQERKQKRALATAPAGGGPGGNGLQVPSGSPLRSQPAASTQLMQRLNYAMLAVLAAVALWGALTLVKLLGQVDFGQWLRVMEALLLTSVRTTVAVLVGAAWTLPVGILIGRSAKWSQRLQPVVQVLASFPAPMLFPLVYFAMLWMHIPFGTGCIVLMMMGTQWYILFNVIAGTSAIPSELKEVARVYHTPVMKRWTRVYIPGVFPHLVTGLITAAGGAWNATIVSECLQLNADKQVTTFGLGSMIAQATDSDFPLLAASTITMALAVVLINRFMWKRLYHLAERKYSLNV